MIRKSVQRFSERSCANNKLKRDGDSSKSHRDLAPRRPAKETRLFESFPKLAEQRLGVVQIDCIEAFAKRLVDRQEKGTNHIAHVPIAKKPRHADRGTQF